MPVLPPYAPIDVATLTPLLRRRARQLGRHFPAHILSHEDHLQNAFLGMLSIRAHDGETPEDLQHRQLTAAKNQMIDGIRVFLGDRRSAHSRKGLDVLVEDIERVTREPLGVPSAEETWMRYCDLQPIVAQLSPRNRSILRARLRGDTMAEIGKQLDVSEGWISQIIKGTIEFLQKSQQ